MKRINTKLSTPLATVALVAMVAATPALADYQATVLSQGPVAYWRLNETTGPVPPGPAVNAGSRGSADDANYVGSPVKGQTGALGGSDKAVAFDGATQWALAPYDASINTATFTVEAWLRPNSGSVPGGLTCALSSMHAASPRSGWLIYQNDGANGGGAPGTGWTLRTYNQNALTPAINITGSNAVVAGTWYHVVATFDGTVGSVYVNGVLKNSQSNPSFIPNVDTGFSIGVRGDAGFPWAGAADDVAYYGSVLTPSQVLAHYNAGIAANPAAYSALVQSSSPLGYWKLDEAGDPVAANLGSLGTAGDAKYYYNAQPNVAGPSPSSSPAYPGFDAGNTGVVFDGVTGSVKTAALNLNTNTVTLTAWIKANGSQAGKTPIVFNQGSSSTAKASLQFDPNGGLFLAYNWNSFKSGINLSNTVAVTDGAWTFASLIIRPDQAILYVPGQPPYTNFQAHPSIAFDGTTFIGANGSAVFNGSIDEVALFNRSLSLGEVYSQYATAVGNLAPTIFGGATAPASIFTGETLKLSVDAGGTPGLTYQWRKSTVAIGGATTSAYTKAGVTAGDNGTYDCVVGNGFGSATSAGAVISVGSQASPAVVTGPLGRTLYQGGSLQLSVAATGGGLGYQWSRNGTPISGATNSTYVLNNVTTNNGGSYTVSITNSAGNASGGPAVINIPVLTNGTYAALVATDGPEAWWRLDETSGSILFDGMGRHDGYYSNSNSGMTLGQDGAIGNGLKGTAVGFSGSADFGWIANSADFNSQPFTVECWAFLTNVINFVVPMSSHDAPPAGYAFDTQSADWYGFIGSGGVDYVLGDTATLDMTIKPGQWVHLAMVYAANGTFPIKYYINGATDAFIWGANDFNSESPFIIGALGHGPGASPDRNFIGRVDEVAIYKKALTAAQVLAHYNTGIFVPNTPPFFTSLPQSQTAIVGSNVTFTATAGGTTPFIYQWLKNGTPIAGKTTNTLTLTNVYFTDAGNYQLSVTNGAGFSNSAIAVLTVEPYPTFANATNGLVVHLKFDGNYTDSSGRNNHGVPQSYGGDATTFVPGKIGANAMHYVTHVDTPPHGTTATAAGYVTIGPVGSPPTDLQFGSSVNFSVSYWIRTPTNYLDGDLPFLCSAAGSYGNFGYTFAPSYNAGGWSWFLGNASAGVGLYGAGASINNGQWHHLLHTFDRLGVGTTYLDGVQVNQTSIVTAGDIDTGSDNTIGQDASGIYPEAGSADIDDVGIWRRVLTQTEALNIYASGNAFGRSFDTYGPVSLTIKKGGSGIELIWQSGTLQSADTVTGPYTPVAGATAPYYTTGPSASKKFYRVQL